MNKLVTILLAVSISLGLAYCKAEARDQQESKMENVKQMIEKGAMVVDVRSPMEYNMGHYPGAVNIPITELQKRVDELGSKDKSIVVYCASGSRSETARNFLKSLGYNQVVNAGGLSQMPR
ncbi:MAG: rhodanese-like domain-containing protein [Leptospiraceae bacterium]|nr:rhodanese-like domain-containing protein [Leptospiraceae bacterium]